MAELNGTQTGQMQRLEQAVAQAFQSALPQMQSQIARQVLDSLQDSSRGTSPSAASHDIGSLVRAVASIHAGYTQKEILRALLDAGSLFSSRLALFVVKAGAANGWQSRGFGDDEAVKDFPLDMNAGPVAHAFHNRSAAPGNIAEMGAAYADHFGKPFNEQVIVLPLALKDKVAALLCADGGDNGKLDADALELLVITTGAWLEVVSLRKQAAPREDAPMPPAPADYAAPPAHTVSSYSDPFASHTPQAVPHVAIEAVAQPEEIPVPAEVVEIAAPAHASAAAAPAVALDPLAALSPEDADLHRKAQRFARLLVDEIKLYNQAKVAEGRRNKDLYDRLQEDIDKSRGTFQKRYGGTVAEAGNYFQRELMRSLAEDDISIMGPNFQS